MRPTLPPISGARLHGRVGDIDAAPVGGGSAQRPEQDGADQGPDRLVALARRHVIGRLVADLMGDHHRHLVLVGRVFDDTAVDHDQAVRAGAGVHRPVGGDAELPGADACAHLVADLGGRRADAPKGAVQGLVDLLVGHGPPLRRTGRLHLALRQAEIAAVDLRQAVHGTGAATDGTGSRQSQE